MKIYLATALVLSTLAVFSPASHATESVASDNIKPLNGNAISFKASELNSPTVSAPDLKNSSQNYALDLSLTNNSFTLNINNLPTSNLIIKDIYLGQPSYSISTTLIKL